MMSVTTTSVLVVILAVVFILYQKQQPPHTTDTKILNASYDYIVVGSGSSGGVLASRLSEDAFSTVLVLEAGGSEEENPFISIPLTMFSSQRTKYDWSYFTVPQKHSCKGFNEQRSPWPRGRVLGGTSCLNTMVYIRCNRHDYDEWEAEGCTGWGYKDVLPYFIKSEDNRIPELRNSVYHGTGGPLPITTSYVTPLADVYKRGMEELGYKSLDNNAEEQEGYSPVQLTISNGERQSTAKAFLRPAMARDNLHVSLNSLVTKVIIENKKAVGVEFIRDGRKHRVMANKEVILSAGAVDSPKLLMLSGIGPKEHLDSLGIPVHADLPVGKNLQDHVFTLIRFYSNRSYAITPEKANTWFSNMKYQLFRKGMLASPGVEGTAFFRTNKNLKFPDVQFEFMSVSPSDDGTHMKTIFNCKDEVGDVIFKRTGREQTEEFWILVIALHPKSRGTIQLESTDPFDPPIIDPNYLEHPDDVKQLIRGIRMAMKLGNTTAFREIGASADDVKYPFSFCNEFPFSSDDYWECYVRHLTFSVSHSAKTCRMGDISDPTVVVDPSLRVKGISNLRVADSSVMRNLPSGNTHAPCMMIGEKAADLIKGIDSVKHIRERLARDF